MSDFERGARNLQAKPRRRHDVVWRETDGEAVILDDTGTILTRLNRVATTIWRGADGETTIEEIAQRLVDEFDVTFERAAADAEAFCRQLQESGLVQPFAPEE